MSQHFDHVVMTVSGTPGTGNITHGAAAPGVYRALAPTVDGVTTNGLSFDLELFDPSIPARSVELDCVYNSATSVLTRGTVVWSSTGSRLSLTSAAIVSVTDHATLGNKLDGGFDAAVRGAALAGVETTITDSAIVNTDSVLTAIRKLIARCANALSRANHTGTQAIATVTNLQTSLDAKAALATAQVFTAAQRGTMPTVTAVSNVLTLDLSAANFARFAPSATFQLANPTNKPTSGSAQTYELRIVQPAGGACGITFAGDWVSSTGAAQTHTTTANTTTILSFTVDSVSGKCVYTLSPALTL